MRGSTVPKERFYDNSFFMSFLFFAICPRAQPTKMEFRTAVLIIFLLSASEVMGELIKTLYHSSAAAALMCA